MLGWARDETVVSDRVGWEYGAAGRGAVLWRGYSTYVASDLCVCVRLKDEKYSRKKACEIGEAGAPSRRGRWMCGERASSIFLLVAPLEIHALAPMWKV